MQINYLIDISRHNDVDIGLQISCVNNLSSCIIRTSNLVALVSQHIDIHFASYMYTVRNQRKWVNFPIFSQY